MFNIKRFDPSQPSKLSPSAKEDEGLNDLARKIQERKNKRKANDAGLRDDNTFQPNSTNAAAASSSSTAPVVEPISTGIGEWTPAPGETPAEREKRLKREKRAAKFGYDPYAASSQPHTTSTTSLVTPGPAGPPAPLPVPSTSTSNSNDLGEWQPAPGESPAEREKRIKREKRALKLGLPLPGQAATSSSQSWNASDRTTTSNNHFVPPPPQEAYPNSYTPLDDSNPSEAVGLSAIHPSRLAAPALAKAVKPKNAQAKTPARLRYLKKKKLRSKGKKKGMKKADGTSDYGTEAGTEAGGSDDDDDEAEEEDEGEKEQKKALVDDEEKARIIAQKKAERKEKRDARKAEIKRLKAEGIAVPAPKPRVIAAKPDSTAQVAPSVKDPSPAPPTSTAAVEEAEQPIILTEKQVRELQEVEERLARKEAKRQKRIARRESKAEEEEAEKMKVDDADDKTSFLIPTGAAPVVADDGEISLADVEMEPINSQPTSKEEPAALLRLPGATRPEPPSKKTLSDLNVHESVRNKQVVDPELKIKIDDEVLRVSEKGRKRLAEMGITEAFAVQTEVLPLLLGESHARLYSSFYPPRDICVSAPTGSGKTLSYVIPIVETLAPRVVTRLRALIILPTRDLVAQVRETFEAFGKGLGLRVGTATGQHSFVHEQAALLGENVSEFLEGGSSLVDILIATPGRLMDHLRATPAFSLQHLRFLVVDEADRLLTQSFNEWLPTILSALNAPVLATNPSSTTSNVLTEVSNPSRIADALAPAWWDSKIGRVASEVDARASSSCQKLLFSATLSRDPAKIDALHLHRPIYVSVEDALDPHAEDEAIDGELKFTFPAQLKEHMIISPATHKPLYLLHLLHNVGLTSALCFTKSVDAANRLAKLVEFFEQSKAARTGHEDSEKARPVVKAYSSDLPPAERMRLLASFKKGDIQMLICSDLISRGIDLPHVSHVVSYDIPADVRKYVHRVGRTARAGKDGDAWSLVEDPEVAPFKSMMKAAQHWEMIKRVRVKDSSVETFVKAYEVALEKLRTHFLTGAAKRAAQADAGDAALK